MRNFKREAIRFAVWLRNGVAFCTTWFLLLILAYHYLSDLPTISTTMLAKVVLLIIGGVLIFNLCFTRLILHNVNFTVRLTSFMCAISLYECLGFDWLGYFTDRGTVFQWWIFIGIVLMLYLLCIVLYRKYQKKQGEIYTRELRKYQIERQRHHEK